MKSIKQLLAIFFASMTCLFMFSGEVSAYEQEAESEDLLEMSIEELMDIEVTVEVIEGKKVVPDNGEKNSMGATAKNKG